MDDVNKFLGLKIADYVGKATFYVYRWKTTPGRSMGEKIGTLHYGCRVFLDSIQESLCVEATGSTFDEFEFTVKRDVLECGRSILIGNVYNQVRIVLGYHPWKDAEEMVGTDSFLMERFLQAIQTLSTLRFASDTGYSDFVNSVLSKYGLFTNWKLTSKSFVMRKPSPNKQYNKCIIL